MDTTERGATLIRGESAPVFEIPGLRAVGLAAPSRGAAETCVWRIRIAAGAPGAEHTVDREEVFVGLSGEATVTVAGQQHRIGPGDALVVCPGAPFSVANHADEPFEAIAVQPVGARAQLPGGEPFVPPWAR